MIYAEKIMCNVTSYYKCTSSEMEILIKVWIAFCQITNKNIICILWKILSSFVVENENLLF